MTSIRKLTLRGTSASRLSLFSPKVRHDPQPTQKPEAGLPLSTSQHHTTSIQQLENIFAYAAPASFVIVAFGSCSLGSPNITKNPAVRPQSPSAQPETPSVSTLSLMRTICANTLCGFSARAGLKVQLHLCMSYSQAFQRCFDLSTQFCEDITWHRFILLGLLGSSATHMPPSGFRMAEVPFSDYSVYEVAWESKRLFSAEAKTRHVC